MVVRSNGKLKKKMSKYEWAKALTDDQLNFLIQLPYTIRFNVTTNQTAIIGKRSESSSDLILGFSIRIRVQL